MKRLFLSLALTALILVTASGQRNVTQNTLSWSEVFSITTSKTNSVYSPSNDGDISGYDWSVTVSTVGLTAPIIIDFGGSNLLIDEATNLYAFKGFEHDSLPYTFNPTYLSDTTNGTVKVFQHFYGDTKYKVKRPEFSLTTTTDTVFTFRVDWLFTK